MKSILLGGLVTGLLLMCIENASADLIANGDFETGNFTGWTATGSVGPAQDITFRAAGGSGNFPSGEWAANFNGGDAPNDGILYQNIVTEIGLEYELSFDYGKFMQPEPGGDQSVRVEVFGLNNSILRSVVVSDNTGTGNLGELLSSYSYTFTANSISTMIQFSDIGSITNSTDGVLDNVAVHSAAPVPEPTTMLLFGTGLAGLVGSRFRKKKG